MRPRTSRVCSKCVGGLFVKAFIRKEGYFVYETFSECVNSVKVYIYQTITANYLLFFLYFS
jgi:hypothetical protein